MVAKPRAPASAPVARSPNPIWGVQHARQSERKAFQSVAFRAGQVFDQIFDQGFWPGFWGQKIQRTLLSGQRDTVYNTTGTAINGY